MHWRTSANGDSQHLTTNIIKYHGWSGVVTCTTYGMPQRDLLRCVFGLIWRRNISPAAPLHLLCLMHRILHQIRCSKYQRHEKSFWKHGATLLTFDGKCFEEQAARDIDSKDSKLCPARTTDVLVISPSGRRWSLPCLQRDDAMQGLVLNAEKLGPFAFSPHFWPFVHPFFAFFCYFCPSFQSW